MIEPASNAVRRSRVPVLALAAIAAGFAALGAFAVASDGLGDSLRTAMHGSTRGEVVARGAAGTPVPPVAGNEAFWLDRKSATAPAAVKRASWTAAMSVGDRFMFGGGNGGRVLEVSEVRRIPGGTGREGRSQPARLHLTLKDLSGNTDAGTVEMLVPEDAPIAGLTPLGSHGPHDL